jgi:predicted ATPase
VILLMGLVTKNAILLVDFANVQRREGMGRTQAVIAAARVRLRPILMTTLAMIAGMLPLAFERGAGAEFRAPMARAVIGGLITSTLLKLIVVPVVYTYLDDVAARVRRWWLRGVPAERRAENGRGGGLTAQACRPRERNFLAMVKNRYFVLTGAFGSGKSTLLERLRLRGIRGIVEPARPILAEQRSIQGSGLPEKDARLFVELMLSRMLSTYRKSDTLPGPILFDRGIPDILGYAKLFGFDFPAGENAARLYRYNPQVFIAPAWEQIYCTDDERTLPFSVAREFGNYVRTIYERLDYTLTDLPCVSVEERADFIVHHVGAA